MRQPLTRDAIENLMRELAQGAPRKGAFQVFLIGGGTAVHIGWRDSTIDADLFSEQEEVFRDIQAIKERLQINVEFVRPEHFVPALAGSDERHVFIETIGRVSFYHYDPYAQLLSKLVRGFRRDLLDAENFVSSDLVEVPTFRRLVHDIPDSAYSRYPALSRSAVLEVVDDFASRHPTDGKLPSR